MRERRRAGSRAPTAQSMLVRFAFGSGIAIAIAHELGLPVKLIGIGESLDDLRPFDADDFARALVGGD